jgi:RimJ/RimL family protein N-acetyltransferase
MRYGPVDMDLRWPLTDDRVTVRPAEDGDAAAFLDYTRRPECQAYVTRTVDTLEQSRALIADRLAEPDSLLCAVVVDGQVIGDIGGRRYQPESLGPEPDAHDFYLGYSINPDRWNRGIASAAAALLVTALHDAGIRRVVAKTFAENAASIRVLIKTGFRLEGTERRAVLGRDSRWLDDCTLAHLAD